MILELAMLEANHTTSCKSFGETALAVDLITRFIFKHPTRDLAAQESVQVFVVLVSIAFLFPRLKMKAL